MPEYASASLFSGTGSGTISLGPNDLRNSIISKTTFDSCDTTNKYKQLMETYCVPQHMNSCFWPSNYNNDLNQCQLNFNGIPKLSTPITGTVQMAAATSSDNTHNNTQSSSINNENLSESLDSSGMYYLTHKKHNNDVNNNDNISPNLIHQNPAVFLPFTAGGGTSPAATAAAPQQQQPPLGTHLIPIRTIGLRSGSGITSGGIILANRDNSISNNHYQSALTTTTPASPNHFHHHHGDENMKDLNNFTIQQTTTITPNR
ncbi:unnamed protein product [Schistosoma margrebowiei]|nr:unnamed protein product [Schistosoma margrebowiei]